MESSMCETWKDIPGTDGYYQASTDGRIRSKKRGHFRIIKPRNNSFTGYDSVILHLESGPITRSVHRLVALTFIPNPNNLPEVNHINEVKRDNSVRNLEWVTSHENNEHSKWKRQKPICMYTVDGQKLATFESSAIASRLLGFDKSHICKAAKEHGTTCHGFVFKYEEVNCNEHTGFDTRRAG